MLSPWSVYDGSIGYQPQPPAAPVISALPRNGNVASRQLSLNWTAPLDTAGIDSFSYSVDQFPDGELKQTASTSHLSTAVTLPADGAWYFHVSALDKAGNWSPTATLPFRVDTTPPAVADLKASTSNFNPAIETVTLTAHLSELSDITAAVLSDKSAPVRGYQLSGQNGNVSIQWDGKDDRGNLVAPGDYRLQITAQDVAGNEGTAISEPITLNDKRIVVSLSQEKLWAYSGNQVYLQTLVTTGGPELPTPIGTFHILQKFSPFTFKSPWPKGSPFWYADSPTNYAMLFDDGGYFIHDAPWRSFFGPGSNVVDGTPGSNNTGTHGCVNVPASIQATLFAWATVGTAVVVQA